MKKLQQIFFIHWIIYLYVQIVNFPLISCFPTEDGYSWPKHVKVLIVARDWVTVQGVWIGNRINLTLKQLATTIHKSLSHED
jgi:hypothetical protein